MIGDIEKLLNGEASLALDASGQPTSGDLQVAVLAVLISAARSDNDIGSFELNKVMSSLFRQFGLKDEEGGHLFEVAEFLLKDKTKHAQFLKMISEQFTEDQKQLLLALVWKVIIADKLVETFEAGHAAKLRTELGLTMEQAVRARMMAENDESVVAALTAQPELPEE